jgi:DNA-binding MarR family transcriptional regulator
MQLPAPALDIDLRTILDAFRHVVHATRAFSQETEEQAGLTGAQLFALQAISRHGPLSVNELAERTHTHQSSVSVVAQRLVEKRLAQKRASPRDRRQVQLSATAKGKTLVARHPNAVQDRLIEALEALAPTERQQLAALLGRVVTGLEPSGASPPMFFSEAPDRE